MKLLPFLLLFLIAPISAQEVQSEESPLANGDIQLPGTLSYPATSETVPLVLFIQGSGNVDRDGNQAGTVIQSAYIKTLRDSLNQRGLGFYSYDKRTAVPGNRSKLKNIRFEDLISDAQLAIEKYASDPRFSSLHLIGHSQGSLVAMMAITPEVRTYISLAGPGVSIDKKIVQQISTQSAELGEIAARHFEELNATDTIVAVNPMLFQIFAPPNHRFLKSYAALDPAKEIKKIRIPTLILNGDADLQISPQDARLLHEALPGSQLKIIPKLNHVLKEVNSVAENQKAYMQPDVPISLPLLEAITQFVSEHR